ncbi:type II toxin-antitoxin system VapC family toxin [Brevundimonas sp.]|jgi:predicted nucleic acid-binding protein|uniref:type II toxin-antitoxin system VapC family toxin n=1 Tax=Brevundimonas sp. TaxID=1871086 RepID=UPI002E15D54E|nr:type II toxin-antitoxin system VapC family toxin [Brevundimonas sp.]
MIVVDASVVIAALLPEAETVAARALLADETCVAPDLLVNECVNALWRNVTAGHLLEHEGHEAVAVLTSAGIVLEPSLGLAGRALALSSTLDHPAYDCFYLALAERRAAPMVTLDGKLARKAWGNAACRASVRLLEP